MIITVLPSSLTSVPDHLPYSTVSPALTSSFWILPESSREPGPAAMTLPWDGFALALAGMMITPADFVSDSEGSHKIRAGSGREFMEAYVYGGQGLPRPRGETGS